MNFTMKGAGPIGRSIIERDIACLSPSYSREYPLVVSHAEGSELWDMDGKRYIDLMAGVAVLNVGHRHPAVVEAVKEQVDKFWHICLSDFYYPQAVDLAEKLQAIAPMPFASFLVTTIVSPPITGAARAPLARIVQQIPQPKVRAN
jgi:4-aminobutyrate aminotransferase